MNSIYPGLSGLGVASFDVTMLSESPIIENIIVKKECGSNGN